MTISILEKLLDKIIEPVISNGKILILKFKLRGFETLPSGISKKKKTDELFCTSCLRGNSKEMPVTEEENGWRCVYKKCGQFYPKLNIDQRNFHNNGGTISTIEPPWPPDKP